MHIYESNTIKEISILFLLFIFVFELLTFSDDLWHRILFVSQVNISQKETSH